EPDSAGIHHRPVCGVIDPGATYAGSVPPEILNLCSSTRMVIWTICWAASPSARSSDTEERNAQSARGSEPHDQIDLHPRADGKIGDTDGRARRVAARREIAAVDLVHLGVVGSEVDEIDARHHGAIER